MTVKLAFLLNNKLIMKNYARCYPKILDCGFSSVVSLNATRQQSIGQYVEQSVKQNPIMQKQDSGELPI